MTNKTEIERTGDRLRASAAAAHEVQRAGAAAGESRLEQRVRRVPAGALGPLVGLAEFFYADFHGGFRGVGDGGGFRYGRGGGVVSHEGLMIFWSAVCVIR